ncbi:MAG: methylenetetrahydrofolate--tRNA-(uracil(54)-C(5))-methyltransferase (FADH(2)-oxidizing) TrmFO [Coriobacteriaceae bacterium]|nr:methylenetetrahydrofolate--tRNA-(uracil(54)-C(5))-methyltransferase (FADH(2)-oxidizing) TrmFO [Coriobacteriaceae bacterium]
MAIDSSGTGTRSGGPATQVTVVGGGLAGCEAALQLAARQVPVRLIEMRPVCQTPVHRSDGLAELVCSNSFKSTDPDTAAGSLKYELQAMGSFLYAIACSTSVPAGGALAVDRVAFSREVERLIAADPLIEVVRREVTGLPDGPAIIATGPLTSDALAAEISQAVSSASLSFYDAAAPIVEAASIDRSIIFAQSRYDKGEGADYLNAPMDREEYERFVRELTAAGRVIEKDFERRELFAACQPIEEVARTGPEALSHGALKPVGLTDPRTGRRPWAAVQLRAENTQRSAYNLVGFQTNLKFGEQQRVFSMIPGLEHAEFSRFGVMHRNTFVDAPHVLTKTLALPENPSIHLAGQLTGTEGYMEAVASGLFVALAVFAQMKDLPAPQLPPETLFGALLAYASDPQTQDYQPMHVNYGIIPPITPPVRNKAQRHAAYAHRAHAAIDAFVAERTDLFAPCERAAVLQNGDSDA